MMASSSKKREALLQANVVATEAISNVRTVASYVNEKERYIPFYVFPPFFISFFLFPFPLFIDCFLKIIE